MILIDTSVWIRSWRLWEGYADSATALLRAGEAGGHELVHGELLIGDTGGRAHFLRDYQLLPWAKRLPHGDAALLAVKYKLCGRGLSWVDVHVLASALSSGWRLWSADERLAAVAHELAADWRPR